MALSSRWQDRNLSKIELVVALLLISIFIGAFSFRALKIFALAERTSVTLTISNMNTALKYRTLMALSKNDIGKLGELESFNPMRLVYSDADTYLKTGEDLINEAKLPSKDTPTNYIGELNAPDVNDITPGTWYFDRSSNLLVYRVKNTEFFYSQLNGPARIRYSIKLEYEDANDNNKYDPEIDKFINISIVSIDKYKWDI